DPGFAAHEFLSTGVSLDTGAARVTAAEAAARYGARVDEVVRRLRAEPSVKDVTFATAAAGEEGTVVIEVDGVPMPTTPVNYNIPFGTPVGHLARAGKVDPRFFSIFEVPLLTGRG